MKLSEIVISIILCPRMGLLVRISINASVAFPPSITGEVSHSTGYKIQISENIESVSYSLTICTNSDDKMRLP